MGTWVNVSESWYKSLILGFIGRHRIAFFPCFGFAALRVKSYDDIIDHCCFAWNRLTDQPWRIMSIGLRSWAYR